MDFENKVLLITGGTGSFGSAVLRKFLKYNLKEIRIFSRDEKKQEDMRQFYKNDVLKFYIGDVRDKQSVDTAMVGVDYVFLLASFTRCKPYKQISSAPTTFYFLRPNIKLKK